MTAAGLEAGFAAYLTFTAILVVTPGTTTALVVRNTLRGGRRAGLATALGAALANSTHATLAGLGLSVLLTHWPSALVAIRLFGAGFVAWLGFQSLWSAFTSDDGGLSFEDGSRVSRPAGVSAFRDGLLINLANPTIITFYIAIVPTFIPAGAPSSYFVLLAAIHVTMALACHAMWSIAFHGLRRWLASAVARRTLAAATGVALILLAIKVLL